ncbi:MAG: AAA family ATPase [Caulobacteraceae bacterium]
MKRKPAKAEPLESPFDADDEFVALGNEGGDWRHAVLEDEGGDQAIEEGAAPGEEIAGQSVLNEASPGEATAQAPVADETVGLMASDPFKALAAQIIETFGHEVTAETAGGVEAPPSSPTLTQDESPLEAQARALDEEVPIGGAPLADPFVGLRPPSPKDDREPGPGFQDDFAAEPGAHEPIDDPSEPRDLGQWTSPALEAPPPAAAEAARPTLGEPVAPRITVHAFCLSDANIELVKGAARDRRMERASTVVRSGGLAAAVDFYQNQPTPSLVVVEAGHSAAELLSLLGRLAEVCDPGTKVVVIGQANDIALYRELMRQGVSDYLVPPLAILQLITAITNLYADPSAPFVGRQMAFCGAKGGVGVSTLAHNFASELSQRMVAGTVIADLDLAFGTAGLNFNQDPVQGIADALSQPDRLDPVLLDRMMVKQSDHLSLFTAPATLDQDYEIHPDAFEEVVRKIRSTAPYLVLDLPHQWSRWKRRLLLTSDEVVIVAEPDLASLRNTKNIVDLVRAARPNDPPPRVVLNKVGLPGRPEIPVKDFGEALAGPPDLIVPFDAKAFGEAANNGQMVTEVAAKSKAAESIAELVRLLTNQRAQPIAPPAKTSLIASLFKRK